MKVPWTRDGLLRGVCLLVLALTIWRGGMRTPEVASVLAPQRFYAELIGTAEELVVEKELERARRAAMDTALGIRLEELRSGIAVPAPDSLIDERSLQRALTRAHTLRVEADDDLLRAQEKLARYKRLRDTNGGAIRIGCSAGEADR